MNKQPASFEALTRRMSRFVCLNDRKAAYHVPHHQATDICHLHSFSFHLGASPLFFVHNAHTHTALLVPTSKASLPLISLITQAVCNRPPSSRAQGNEKEMGGGKKKKEEENGPSIHPGGVIASKRRCFGSKTFTPACVRLIC